MTAEAVAIVRRFGIEEAVSGGAAFADHAAVRLFLEGHVGSLRLYLPAPFNGRAFEANSRVHSNPGSTANEYHAAFQRSCGVNGLSEIAAAITKGAKVETYNGFKRRNLEVAGHCTHMVAFTFGNQNSADFQPSEKGFTSSAEAGLKDGGTAHTWGECWKAEWKRHVNLRELEKLAA